MQRAAATNPTLRWLWILPRLFRLDIGRRFVVAGAFVITALASLVVTFGIPVQARHCETIVFGSGTLQCGFLASGEQRTLTPFGATGDQVYWGIGWSSGIAGYWKVPAPWSLELHSEDGTFSQNVFVTLDGQRSWPSDIEITCPAGSTCNDPNTGFLIRGSFVIPSDAPQNVLVGFVDGDVSYPVASSGFARTYTETVAHVHVPVRLEVVTAQRALELRSGPDRVDGMRSMFMVLGLMSLVGAVALVTRAPGTWPLAALILGIEVVIVLTHADLIP